MKYRDVRDVNEWENQQQTISNRRESLSSWRSESLKRVTNYLFILNSGALWSSFAYLAKPEIGMTPLLRGSITYFAMGTVLILIHAATDYYMSEHSLRAVDNTLSEYYRNKLDWNVVQTKIYASPKNALCIEAAGWGSGVAFVLGLICAGLRILG